MASPLTPDEHESKKWEAYRLSLRGWHAPAIGRKLDISATTVKTLLKEARREIARDRKAAGHDDLAVFLAEQDYDRAESYRMVDDPQTPGTAKPAHIANARGASVDKAKALGVLTERQHHSGEVSLNVRGFFAELEKRWGESSTEHPPTSPDDSSA